MFYKGQFEEKYVDQVLWDLFLAKSLSKFSHSSNKFLQRSIQGKLCSPSGASKIDKLLENLFIGLSILEKTKLKES